MKANYSKECQQLVVMVPTVFQIQPLRLDKKTQTRPLTEKQ